MEKLMENLGQKLGVIFNFSIDSFSFEKEEWKKYNIVIGFEFQNANLRNLIYGLKRTDNIPKDLEEYLKNFKSSDWWSIYSCMNNYANWDKDFFNALYNNEDEILNVFKSIIEEISAIMKDYKHG
jgi:hypothetical protein